MQPVVRDRFVPAMTLRPPTFRSNDRRESALDYEIVQEQAAALSRLGHALEVALAALSRHDRTDRNRDDGPAVEPSTNPEREKLLRNASDALWCFVVQREACGLRDQRPIFRAYDVPAEVKNRMGVFETSGQRRVSS
jgi:hypothetical protein